MGTCYRCKKHSVETAAFLVSGFYGDRRPVRSELCKPCHIETAQALRDISPNHALISPEVEGFGLTPV